ncbi:MAG: potassium channel family protein [Thermodesulfobacteriota bacterium]
MLTFRKILQLSASLLAILILGSLGFVWLEGWSFFDALYMTVTTLTTVGYGEVHPLNALGKAYNMVLIMAGMGLLFYIVTSLARVVVEGEIAAALGKRKLLKRIKKLNGHYIICGYGRLGEIIARQLQERHVPLVVVENNLEITNYLDKSGYYFVAGDATKEEVLLEAGIERARGLVSVVHSDASNVYIVLTARSLNPSLFIVARGEEPGSRQKLIRAGADKVESPYELGGRKMAHTILRPTVTTLMELAMQEGVEWSMEEVAVGTTAAMIGLPLKDSGIRQQYGLIVVAIKRADGEILFNPSPAAQVLAGDTLILIGMRKNLEALEEILH